MPDEIFERLQKLESAYKGYTAVHRSMLDAGLQTLHSSGKVEKALEALIVLLDINESIGTEMSEKERDKLRDRKRYYERTLIISSKDFDEQMHSYVHQVFTIYGKYLENRFSGSHISVRSSYFDHLNESRIEFELSQYPFKEAFESLEGWGIKPPVETENVGIFQRTLNLFK